jgi:hypothetical protein
MAIKKYTCPPQKPSGERTFSDNLVGLQLTQGGGLTQGNFEFTESITEKSNRNFITGIFSDPINLDSLGILTINESKTIVENNFKVYPNFDLSEVTNFTLFGSMVKRMETSIQKIINYFPAAIVSTYLGSNYKKGPTANNIVYNPIMDETSFELNVSRLRNPFEIDFTINSTRNLSLKEIEVSELRNLTVNFAKYSLYLNNQEYVLTYLIPTQSLSSGTLKIYVSGNPFSGLSIFYSDLVIRPNDAEVNVSFNENFDEVEDFLLNRSQTPIYTASFNVPRQNEDGTYYVGKDLVTWPLYDVWNLDILTDSFENYLTKINDISENFDSYRTNLVSRFLTTGAFKDFDTEDRKMEKVLQIYGRSFDETRKYINALAYMNSVNYNTGNDIPSQLLKNLAQTLGWNTNISPITNDDFLNSIFGSGNYTKSNFTGVGNAPTPDELNIQFYKNVVLNASWLFKSKGTRKSIETLMRLIGAPESLVEFNEYVYVADQKINMADFNQQFAKISGGTYAKETPVLDPTDTFTIYGDEFTGYTTQITYTDVSITIDEYPIDSQGYPQTPPDTENYFFQIGSGWFEQTPDHRAPEQPDLTNSVFTGANPNYQTTLIPYTYGQVYLDRFRKLPYTNLGFELTPIVDNKKSWTNRDNGLRENYDGNFYARYETSDDRLVLNVKNVDLFMNPAQGLVYDVWYMSKEFNFPIPNQGLNYVAPTNCVPNPYSEYPKKGGVDWTEIDPKPAQTTFFEFAQTFWVNMINVRNRQFAGNGKTMGYPTLESIYWKYLESQNLAGVQNDNFNYNTMIQYVKGLGDYWVRLVEQMIPASTIWNTGVKYENSAFHRQKFVWRRQQGCQLEPIPCTPCEANGDFFPDICPTQSVECERYPGTGDPDILNFGTILSDFVTDEVPTELTNCELDTMTSQWVVEIVFDNSLVSSFVFFNGVGFNTPDVSYPNQSDWDYGLSNALQSLNSLGLSYYYTIDNKVVIYNLLCSESKRGLNFLIRLKINFDIYCNK